MTANRPRAAPQPSLAGGVLVLGDGRDDAEEPDDEEPDAEHDGEGVDGVSRVDHDQQAEDQGRDAEEEHPPPRPPDDLQDVAVAACAGSPWI